MIQYRRNRRARRFNESITFQDFERRTRTATDLYKTRPGMKRNDARMEDIGKVKVVPFVGASLISRGFESGNPNLSIKLEVESLKSGKVYTNMFKVMDFWPGLIDYMREDGFNSPEDFQNVALKPLDKLITDYFQSPELYRHKIEVFCNCHDFKFGGGKEARRGGYVWVNEDEEIKSPSCKHSMMVAIRISDWTDDVARYISRNVLKNPEMCQKLYDNFA